MKKPLSYSAYKRFVTCPKFYYFHDIEKDRPGKMTSALLVGTFLDTTINNVLLKKPDNPILALNALIASVQQDDIEFYTDDLDIELISIPWIESEAKKMGWEGSDIAQALKDMMKDQAGLSVKQRKIFNKAVWASLQVKCQAMLASFQKWILPQIKEVHEIQTHLDNWIGLDSTYKIIEVEKLPDRGQENVYYLYDGQHFEYDPNTKAFYVVGGRAHGYLDFVATLTDGRKVLFDLKTSKMPYKPDAVLTSPQLSLYASMKDCEYAGYIILVKNLNKNKIKTCSTCDFEVHGGNRIKCPVCKTALDVVSNPTSYSQLLVDKIPDHNKKLTVEAMTDTIKCIDNGVFPRNLNQCQWMYGKPCIYIDKCWKDKK